MWDWYIVKAVNKCHGNIYYKYNIDNVAMQKAIWGSPITANVM